MGDGTTVYYVHAGEVLIPRAVLQFFKCCIDDVLVYNETNRRRGIASALYHLIETELGRSLRPSRVRPKARRALWASPFGDHEHITRAERVDRLLLLRVGRLA